MGCKIPLESILLAGPGGKCHFPAQIFTPFIKMYHEVSVINLIISPLFKTRAVVGQRSSPAGYILYCNIFIIKPYNIGHTDLDVFVCKSFCHIDIIIQV